MSTDIVVPKDLYEEDEEAVVTSWLVDDGTQVEAGSLVAELMTAKVQYEILAPSSGTVSILKQVDDVVAKGDIIGTVN
ncbi:biotin/lipoyl-containing protein [Granulosicoccus sp. 3-233]|uniref:biotin/lipoyl-containing protein n=1 Tax=Granulosicoccus sp. 3-233 TaxID=3417969 RepID=UPI003D354E37